MKKELAQSAGNPLTDNELKDYLVSEAKETQELIDYTRQRISNIRGLIDVTKTNNRHFDWDLWQLVIHLNDVVYYMLSAFDSLGCFRAGIETKFNKFKSEPK